MTKRQTRKTKTNPLWRKQARLPRPISMFDGANLNGSHVTGTAAVVGFVYAQAFYVSATSNFGVATTNAALMNNYNEYKFNKLQMELFPVQGPSSSGAGGRIYVAYVDNPEIITGFNALATDVLRIAAIKGMRDMKQFNLWERFTYNVPLTSRRKLFDVDNTPAGITTDILDRTTQGAVLIAVEGVNAADSIGMFRFTYNVRLHGLSATLGT